MKLMVEHTTGNEDITDRKQTLYAEEALKILKGISDVDSEALGLNKDRSRPE